MGELWRRLYYLFNRARLERELQEEMAIHRELLGEDAPRFGSPLRVREQSQDVWGWAWWDRLVQDLTFASRVLRKSPAFTLTAIAVLAVGVGVNLAAFQVLNTIAWRPLPVKDPDSLVRFTRKSPTSSGSSFSYPVLAYYREHATVLTAAMGVIETQVALEGAATRDLSVEFVTANYLSELGAVPALGRLLDPGRDDVPDAEPVIVLSHGLWTGRFGADPAVVGRAIRINDRPFTIVGVAQASFVGLRPVLPAAWMPLAKQPYAFPGSDLLTNLASGPVNFFGRLAPGLTPSTAEDGMRPLAATLAKERPNAVWTNEWPGVRPAGRFVTLDSRSAPFIAIASAFTIVLLLAACANLGTLMLARGVSREREVAIRLSLGATRPRIVRQLLTESSLVAVLGTAAGLALSAAAARVFLAYIDAPAFLQPRLDVRVLACALVLAGVAASLFGLAPALQTIRLKTTRARMRGVLVAVQVATGCVLLVVSGLLVRGLQHVSAVPLGFEFAQHVAIDPGLTANGFKPAAARAYWTQLRGRVDQTPGVAGTALSSVTPLGQKVSVGRNPDGSQVYYHAIDPSYFAVMGIPLVAGRPFQPEEPAVAVVSQSFARVLWPNDDPLGKVHKGRTVVGVAGNAATLALNNPDATEFYTPIRDADLAEAALIVRVQGDTSAVLPMIVTAARSADTRVAPVVTTLRQGFDSRLRTTGQMAAVIGSLGMLALALAAIGLAGLLAFSVSQRTREIAISMALGARPLHIVRAVLHQFALPVGCGLGAGLVAAGLLSMVLRRELFGLSHLDPVSYASAVAIFAAVAVTAAVGPLRKAITIAPIDALRSH
jgi:predicted permease